MLLKKTVYNVLIVQNVLVLNKENIDMKKTVISKNKKNLKTIFIKMNLKNLKKI